MKNSFLTLVILLSALCMLGACKKKKVSTDPQDNTTPTSGILNLASDECFQPIIEQEIAVFQAKYPKAKIKPVYTSEVHALNLFLKDSVRVAIVTRRLTPPELESMKQRLFIPNAVLIARDAVALIVNPANKDTLISVSDFKDIMTGKVTRWNQLDPKSKLGELTLVFDNKNSSTLRYAMDSICQTRNIATKNVKAMEHNKDVIDFVASTPNAIGVIGSNWLGDGTDTTNLNFRKDVRVMSVSREPRATAQNSYKPYQAYIYYNYYPMTRPIYLLYNDPQGALPYSFMGFIANQDVGQRIILKTGLVPANVPISIVQVKKEDE